MRKNTLCNKCFHFLLGNGFDYFENSLKLDALTYILLHTPHCAKHHIGILGIQIIICLTRVFFTKLYIMTAGTMTAYFKPAFPMLFTVFGVWRILNKCVSMSLNTVTLCACTQVLIQHGVITWLIYIVYLEQPCPREIQHKSHL